jgi:hypothetical protein
MDLQGLLDEREIRGQLARFARLLDGKHHDRIEEVFADEVGFDYGIGGEQAGIEALRALFRHFLDSCGPTQHLIGSILVELDGDSAVSHSYVQARHQKPGDTIGAVLDTNGDYVDRWERKPQGWRIVRRDVHWHIFTGGHDVLEGFEAALSN